MCCYLSLLEQKQLNLKATKWRRKDLRKSLYSQYAPRKIEQAKYFSSRQEHLHVLYLTLSGARAWGLFLKCARELPFRKYVSLES